MRKTGKIFKKYKALAKILFLKISALAKKTICLLNVNRIASGSIKAFWWLGAKIKGQSLGMFSLPSTTMFL